MSVHERHQGVQLAMTAKYNRIQKKARRKAKENRKKDRVREAIAKSHEKKGRAAAAES